MVCGSSEYPLHIPAFSRCFGNGGVASGRVSSTSLGIRRDFAERSIDGVLLSTSALLLGSSGYAPAIMFAPWSYVLIRQNWSQFSPHRLIGFWTASILGILSHLSFVIVSTALLLSSVANEIRIAGSYRRWLIHVLAHHLPPFAFFVWFYVFFARDMVVGGGPLITKWDVITQASTLLFGFPENLFFAGVGVLCLMAVLVAGGYTLYRDRDEQ